MGHDYVILLKLNKYFMDILEIYFLAVWVTVVDNIVLHGKSLGSGNETRWTRTSFAMDVSCHAKIS